jgi:hypothetical protein
LRAGERDTLERMAENETSPSAWSERVLRALALVLLVISALISAFIWILGTGVPWTTHATMGLFFIALNLGVLIFIVASPPKYSGLPLVAAVLIVPIEIAAIFLIAFAEEAIKSWLK